jgi:hypothetical protein
MTRSISVAARDVEVLLDADVVVVGGGSAGLASAVAAAQSGARTVLIERYGFFGGNATAAWVGTICGLYRKDGEGYARVTGGLAGQWADALATQGMGYGPVPFKRTAVFITVPWACKELADRWIRETPALTPLLHCLVTDVVTEDSRVLAVIISTKRGPRAVTGTVFIDATGDADLAFHAGAGVDDARDAKRQFPSMQFWMGNVDLQAAMQAGLEELQRLLAGPGQQDPWNLSRSSGAVLPTLRPGEVIGAMTRIAVDGRAPDMTDPFQATSAEIQGRSEAARAGAFLIEHMPGFRDAFFGDTPTQLGVRETRRAIGDHVMTGEEVLGAARFDDAIASGAWPQEFHTEGKETSYVWLDDGASYQVPLRSLIVAGLDGLLTAGRCMSATHEALASTRVIAPSMATGEAAGVAAALAATRHGDVRAVDPGEVQQVLRRRGVIIEA